MALFWWFGLRSNSPSRRLQKACGQHDQWPRAGQSCRSISHYSKGAEGSRRYGRWRRRSGGDRNRRGRGHRRCRHGLDLGFFQSHGRDAVDASGPGNLADGECEAFYHSSRSGDDDLVCLESCTHTPYLARHCRWKLVGSLPWGIPMIVDCWQTGVQATNLMVTQDTDNVLIQVRPPWGRNTYILRLIVLIWGVMNWYEEVPCLSLYSTEGRVTNLETNPSRLQLP